MVQPTAKLPDKLVAELDANEDLRCGVAALKDPADPILDWAEVRDALLIADAAVCDSGL